MRANNHNRSFPSVLQDTTSVSNAFNTRFFIILTVASESLFFEAFLLSNIRYTRISFDIQGLSSRLFEIPMGDCLALHNVQYGHKL